MPHIKLVIAGGILAGAVAYDAGVFIRNRAKFQKVVEENKNLRSSLSLTLKQMDYMCHLLDENGVTISEFDMIALNNPT